MDRDFTIVLRGYEMPEVERVLAQADQAVASGSEESRATALGALRTASFAIALRGYDRGQVDQEIAECRAKLGDDAAPRPSGPVTGPPRGRRFGASFRGYDRAEVDRALGAADDALAAENEFARAAARDALRGARFTVVLRGYARDEVDQAVEQRLAQLS